MIPKHLSHKPIVGVDNYERIDGHTANNTDARALSVGFAIAEYGAFEAFVAAAIIAVVTFFICIGGILIGRKAGSFLAWRASILGGTILIGIGLEIWISNIFFS